MAKGNPSLVQLYLTTTKSTNKVIAACYNTFSTQRTLNTMNIPYIDNSLQIYTNTKNTANTALCSYWLVRIMYCILIGWLA